MTGKERRACLESIRIRYLNSNRLEKERILTEFCATCGYHRKYAIRLLNAGVRVLLNGPPARQGSGARGRPSRYRDARFETALRRLWREMDHMCSKNLKGALPAWLPAYEEEYGAFETSVRERLLLVSAATIDRVLKPSRSREGKGRCGTRPGSLLRSQIPIRTTMWDVKSPGFMEGDTVAHCGGSLSGEFVWSLTLTDICTTWTEVRSVWHKAPKGVVAMITDMERTTPFPLLAFDSDNGGEFINQHLVRNFQDREHVVFFSRSRPYRKNDNAHVEQKNYTHARQLLGYDRIDNPEVVEPLNEILRHEFSLLRNHFYPTRKLLGVVHRGGKNVKLYDTPKTPYQRVLEQPEVAADTKKALREVHASLNPVKLRKQMNAKLRLIMKQRSVTSFVSHRNGTFGNI